MARRMLYSFGLLLSLLFICQSMTDVRNVQAAEFDQLTEEQKDAAMALLKQAVSETNADPLELIRKGMEKVKEEQEKTMMNDEPEFESGSTMSEPLVTSSTASAVESSSSDPPTELSSTARPEGDEPERAPATDAPEVVPPPLVTSIDTSSTAKPEPETTSADPAQPSSPEPFPPSLSESVQPSGPVPSLTTSTTSSTTGAPVEPELLAQPSEPTPAVNNNQQDQSDQQEEAKDVAADKTTTPAPADSDYENVYIDESDPNDPKRVHVKNRTKSKIDKNGYSHVHHESVSSTSLGNNPNSFSKHSSSFSSSGSSSAFVNGKPVKPIKWTYNTMKPFATIPPVTRIPSIPPIPGMPTMPPMPPMPIMSFGSMMPTTWPGYYGQNYEDYGGYPVQASAYAGAYAGLPENFFGAPHGGMSRRKAKKLARKQERAARRAQDYEFYQ